MTSWGIFLLVAEIGHGLTQVCRERPGLDREYGKLGTLGGFGALPFRLPERVDFGNGWRPGRDDALEKVHNGTHDEGSYAAPVRPMLRFPFPT
jgi:hypothetical protein